MCYIYFKRNSWEKPIYEKYNMKNNEISYFTEINSEIINGNYCITIYKT